MESSGAEPVPQEALLVSEEEAPAPEESSSAAAPVPQEEVPVAVEEVLVAVEEVLVAVEEVPVAVEEVPIPKDNEALFKCSIEGASDPICLMVAFTRLFDQHFIPYVVWGTCCLYYHGVPTWILDIAFVISDAFFDQVVSLFERYPSYLTRCRCNNSIHYDPDLHEFSIPPVHFTHIASSRTPIELWKQSDVMPMVDLGQTGTDIVQATPEREGGRRKKHSHTFIVDSVHVPANCQVRYLSATCMREIAVFLTLRDVDRKNMDWGKWMEYVSYVYQYVPEEELAQGFRSKVLERVHTDWFEDMSLKRISAVKQALLAEGNASWDSLLF